MSSVISNIQYILNKIQKKMRLSAIKESNVHPTSKIESGSIFYHSFMDKYSFCGYDCEISFSDVGAYCSISSNVIIGATQHPIDWTSTSPVFFNNRDSIRKKFSRYERESPIHTYLGNDVWVGNGCFLKAGITVGTGAIIGMGSVVTKDVPPYAIVAGNPAKLVRMRFEKHVIALLLESEWWMLSDDKLSDLSRHIKDPEKFVNAIHELGLSDR